MGSILPNEVAELGQLFVDTGHDIRAVGGWVRDTLRGVPPKDLDLATTATPDEMIALCEKHGLRYITTGLKHGTISIVTKHPIAVYEVTTLRIDAETDGRHARVEFTNDWRKDAERRDFTVNAMSMSLDHKIHDYFGGQQDLAQKRVVFVGDPDQRIREDYLRILRYFRFSGLLGDLNTHSYERIIQENVAGLEQISRERIWLEMAKILSGYLVGRQLLGMSVMGVFPHIGLPGIDAYAIDRAIIARNATTNPITVLAALTDCPAGLDWKMSRHERDLLESLQSARPGGRPTVHKLRDMATSGRNGRDHAIEHAALFGPSEELDVIRAWNVPDFPVRGADLVALGMSPGPDVGLALDKLKHVWKDSGYQMGKDALIGWLYAED